MGPGDGLADLAAELLRSGSSAEKVLEVIGLAKRDLEVAAPAKRGRKPRDPRPGYVTHEQVLGSLAGKPLTPEEIRGALGLSPFAVQRHLRRAIELGNVKKVGAAYSLTKGGRASARAVTRGRTTITQEALLEKLRTLGPLNTEGLRDAFGGASQKAVWQHLNRAEKEGLVTKGPTKPYVYTLAGRGRKKKTAAKPSPKKGTGRNDERIVGALTRAKGPLKLDGFIEAIPEFRKMSEGARTMALSNSVKQGHIVRIAKGVYALPGHKAKKSPKDGTDASKLNGAAHA